MAALGLLLAAACSHTAGTIVGTITAVDGDLTEIRSFTVLVEGDQMVFVPIAEGAYDYPLSHLREHLRDGTPIRVGWEKRGDQLAATSVEDA
jgi:hypothetical protein